MTLLEKLDPPLGINLFVSTLRGDDDSWIMVNHAPVAITDGGYRYSRSKRAPLIQYLHIITILIHNRGDGYKKPSFPRLPNFSLSYSNPQPSS